MTEPTNRSRRRAGPSVGPRSAAADGAPATAGATRPPSVERILALVRAEAEGTDPETLAGHVRAELAAERARLAGGLRPTAHADLAVAVLGRLGELMDPLRSAPPRVLNGTGVILHTNLGRAPWPEAARLAALEAARGPGYLELDEATGRRGRRFAAAEEHLVALTGAEAGLVVANAAAALLLTAGLAGRRGGIAVSRGELVEIGGGVRIPEIVARAGARLVEVGTTNRTRADDFREPLAGGRATLVLRVHPSNFVQAGFVETPDPGALAALARRHGVAIVDDLGSGAFLDTAAFGLAHEPTPRERLAAGADLVLFSGDKLVGGPQAGLVAGRADLVARLRRDPLARAVRPDKAILAGVAATLAIHRAGRALTEIPVWRMIAAEPAELRRRAALLRERLAGSGLEVEVAELVATVGGGSIPGGTLPSAGLALRVSDPVRAAARLRSGRDAVLARVAGDRLLVDLRTIPAPADETLGRRLAELAAGAR